MRSFDPLDADDAPAAPFQAVSLHSYTHAHSWERKGSATDFGVEEWYATLAHARRMEELVTRHSTVMDRYDPHRKVGLVVDEWGTWFDPAPGTNPGFLQQQNTLRDALVAAVHLDVFHRHAERVVMANLAQAVNVLQAVLLTDPATDALVLTPTFHVFEMNTGHHDAAALAVHLKGVEVLATATGPLPVVSASASVTGDTALISLANLHHAEPRTLLLDLRGRSVTGHRARVLTAPDLASHNTAADPDAVAPAEHAEVARDPRGLRVVLPAHAYVTVALELAPAQPGPSS
jgi:alpha-N-arabinofuranosidase